MTRQECDDSDRLGACGFGCAQWVYTHTHTSRARAHARALVVPAEVDLGRWPVTCELCIEGLHGADDRVREALLLQLLLNGPLLSRLLSVARLELDGEASPVAFASLADQQVRSALRVASQLGHVASHLALLVRASILDANGTLQEGASHALPPRGEIRRRSL